MAEATSIGALIVRIGGDADDLIKELKRADAGLSSFHKGVKTAHELATAFAGAAAAAGAAVLALVTITAKAADEMYKMAQSAGLSVTAFSELAYAANLSGVATESFNSAMSKLNRNVSEAAQGTGAAAEAFRVLHLSARDTNGQLKNAEQVMEEVGNLFASFADGPEKSALAIALFGRAGAQMIPMLNRGADGMRAMREEAKALGVSISSETGKAAEEFKENLERLEKGGQGVANQLMKELLPAMNHVTEMLVDASKSSGQFKDEIATLARFIEGAAVTAFETFAIVGSDVAFTFKMVGGELGVIGAQVAAILRGDFKGAKLIGDEWMRDSQTARAELDKFQAKVLEVRGKVLDHGSNSDGGAMDMGVGLFDYAALFRKAAPRMMAELQKEIDKMQREANELFATAMSKTAVQGPQGTATNTYFSVIEDSYDNVVLSIHDKAKSAAEAAAMFADALLHPEKLAAGQDGGINPEKDAKIQALDQQLKTAERLENESYNVRKAGLKDFTDGELAALGGRQAIEAQMTQQHTANLMRIQRDKEAAVRSMQISTLQLSSELLQQFASKSKVAALAVIAINKGLAAAQVVMSAEAAKMRAMQELGPIAGPAAVATITTLEYVSLGLIAATGLVEAANSGGSGGGNTGGSSIAAPTTLGGQPTPVSVATPAASAPNTTIILQGDFFNSSTIRKFVDALNENARDGGRIQVQG